MKIGGQAVMEGIMMKSKRKAAVAVRILKTKKIKTKVKKVKPASKIFKLPFLRGIYSLIDSLRWGIWALVWSSNQNLEQGEKIKTSETIFTLTFSLVIGLGLFLGLPFLATKFLVVKKGFWFGLIEGLFRVSLVIAYIRLIGFSKEIKKLFQYHGAEHKVIHCYESGQEVTLKNAKQHTTLHPRCGTSFIFIVLLLSIIIFSFLEINWLRILWKLLLIPVIAGLSYEILKLGDKFQKNPFFRIIIWPGLALQKMTTKQPSKEQLEVGIKVFEKVVK